MPFDGNEVIGGWCRYDCTWYRDIADRGYTYVEGVQSSVAFFPPYPLVARLVGEAIHDTPLALTIVTWIAGLAALMLFAHSSARRLDRRLAMLAVVCFALYPYGWFLYGAGYADALFLAFAIGAFVLLEADHPVLAGLAGAAAAATRPISVAVDVGLLLQRGRAAGGLRRVPQPVEQHRGQARDPVGRDLPAPPATARPRCAAGSGRADWWSVWLWTRFDDPFLYSTVQKTWDQAEGPHTWFKIGFGGQLLHGVTPDTASASWCRPS